MFGKKHHQGRRSPNILFVIFRLLLSLVMFVVLLAGIYSAYKHFSGLDPLKIDPWAVFNNVITARTPQQFSKALSSLKINPKILGRSIQAENPPKPEDSAAEENSNQAKPLFQFMLFADSHNDNIDLDRALNQARSNFDPKFIIGLGDYTEVGTIAELKAIKEPLDSSSLRYFLIPGDHDLWDCRNRNLVPVSCFNEVFGPSYQSFVFENFMFLMLDNSDNYTGLSSQQLDWISKELERAAKDNIKEVFVFMHKPLYHPSSDHVMGGVEKNLKSQAAALLLELKGIEVAKVFAGDTHFFSQYIEPKTNLPMVTVGAVALERNPQVPRFAVVSVFEDGSTKVEDIEIK